jgi:hypothetical protein
MGIAGGTIHDCKHSPSLAVRIQFISPWRTAERAHGRQGPHCSSGRYVGATSLLSAIYRCGISMRLAMRTTMVS